MNTFATLGSNYIWTNVNSIDNLFELYSIHHFILFQKVILLGFKLHIKLLESVYVEGTWNDENTHCIWLIMFGGKRHRSVRHPFLQQWLYQALLLSVASVCAHEQCWKICCYLTVIDMWKVVWAHNITVEWYTYRWTNKNVTLDFHHPATVLCRLVFLRHCAFVLWQHIMLCNFSS